MKLYMYTRYLSIVVVENIHDLVETGPWSVLYEFGGGDFPLRRASSPLAPVMALPQ